ncbi:hypothetical protein NCCP2050_29640 [Planococcus sp. NCCP-2050]|nr:hypothetical protein NCCP2050_29640 [Planococcus sp. NCCP-2050]
MALDRLLLTGHSQFGLRSIHGLEEKWVCSNQMDCSMDAPPFLCRIYGYILMCITIYPYIRFVNHSDKK